MMWNTNSDQIADLVLKWIEKHIEKKESEDALVSRWGERSFSFREIVSVFVYRQLSQVRRLIPVETH